MPPKLEYGLILDVVVRQRPAILKLKLEDQTLMVCRNSFLFLDLGLDIVDSIGCLNVQGDGLACRHLDVYLHAFAEA